MTSPISLAGHLHDTGGGSIIALPKAVFPHEGASLLGLVVALDEPVYIAYDATEAKTYVDRYTGQTEFERQLVVTVMILGGDVLVEDMVGKAARAAQLAALKQQDPSGNLAAQYARTTPIPTRSAQPGELVRQYLGKRHVYFAAKKALNAFRKSGADIAVGTTFIQQRGKDEWVGRDGKPLQEAKRPYTFVFREANPQEAAWIPTAIEKHHSLQPAKAAPSLAGNVQPEPFPAAAPAPAVAAPVYAPAPVAQPQYAAAAPMAPQVAQPVMPQAAPQYAQAAPVAQPVAQPVMQPVAPVAQPVMQPVAPAPAPAPAPEATSVAGLFGA